MFVYALIFTVIMIAVLKLVDWRGDRLFDDITKVRTRIFGGVAVGVVASLALGLVELFS